MTDSITIHAAAAESGGQVLVGLIDRYRAGATFAALAGEVGCDPTTVRRRLLAAGVTLRPSSSGSTRGEQWWREQLENRSVAELAKELSITTQAVYQQIGAVGIRLAPTMPPFREWLWARVRVDGDCLRWTRSRNSVTGYGRANRGGRTVLVRRLVWEQQVGLIPVGWELTRTSDCPHPDCVRVEHLRCEPPRQRIRDKVVVGAFAHGEQHWNVKLTEDDARAILSSSAPQSELAARYGVSRSTVREIRAGRRWRHLQHPYADPAVPSALSGV